MARGVMSEVWSDCFLENLAGDIFGENLDDDPPLDARVDSFFEIRGHGKTCEYKLKSQKFSPVELVGLQLWRGALLLADYIWTHPEKFEAKNVLELAAGTGFTSIVAATFASHVLCTDVDRAGILDLIRENFRANEDAIRAEYEVGEIDFFATEWRQNFARRLGQVDVVLAADIVYDERVTRAFFDTLSSFLASTPKKDRKGAVEIYIAVERRLHATGRGISSPSFDLFVRLLDDFVASNPRLALHRVALDFDHCLRDKYERVGELNMWQIDA